ncbi:MAG: site-specific DNA-methyltransferase [Ignavibacteriae bacterium]|nr:site-specific DNA-methyltransferase [Ignavibacteriota bacterium]NOG98164.1 site-specific DNA-methyltransferase [Ignavibacteriota bacterium]
MNKYENLSKEELLKLVEKQEKELKNKKYGLVWDSEREPEQVVLDCENNLPVLKRVKGKEIRTNDEEDNLLIEGDNYHALTVLNYTHKGKIDVIYIDPPYNTGKPDNIFLYNDKIIDLNDTWRHSKWLNFISKRLKLARALMKQGCPIFISIDDNEVANLRLLCDQIFGESNFIACLPTIMNLKGNQDQFGFAGTHEYTLVYCYDKTKTKLKEFEIDDETDKWLEDEYGYYKKGANLKATGVNAPREKRPFLYYPILVNSETRLVTSINDKEYERIYNKETKSFNDNFVNRLKIDYEKMDFVFLLPVTNNEKMSWRWKREKIIQQEYDLIVVGEGKELSIYKKQRPAIGDLPSKKAKSLFYKPEYSSGNGTAQLKKIFGRKVFNNPKPIELIKDFLKLSTNKNSLILDFFAGSGTTAQALLELNSEVDGRNSAILCTNNENNICKDVTYPRIQKVIKGFKKNGNGEFIEGLGGNLQYFKTSFVNKTKNRDQVKVNLTRKCTEMLCVKENIFNEEAAEDDFKIFSSNKKDKFLCVYYNFIDDSFDNFINKLKELKGKKIIYMFSLENKVDRTLFKGISNFTIEAIPQKILDVYKQLVKMNIPEKKEVIFIELNKANKKIFDENEKDDGARVLRIVLHKTIQKIAQSNGINILNQKGKEEKISKLNDTIKNKNVFTQVEWEQNKTCLTIGNHSAHGEYDEYDLKDVKNFYKHVQTLLDNFGI